MTPGTIVEIKDGPWVGLTGVVEDDEGETLVVRLRSLVGGGGERVMVEQRHCQPVDLRVTERR